MIGHRRLVVYRRDDRKWDWRLIAGNNEIVASSLQGFETAHDALVAANREHPEYPAVIEDEE